MGLHMPRKKRRMFTLDELENRWQPTSQAVLHTMKEWRQQHPKATFQDMETALDEQLARLRAQMLRSGADQSERRPAQDEYR